MSPGTMRSPVTQVLGVVWMTSYVRRIWTDAKDESGSGSDPAFDSHPLQADLSAIDVEDRTFNVSSV